MAKERVERVGDISVRVYSPESVPTRGAVVLVHGICMTGKVWQRWADKLASRGIEAWALDLRGHGQSAGLKEVGQARIEDYAADVEAVLDAAGSHALVGHDMGGLVAQLVATRRELKGMVLVGTVAPRGLTGRSNVLLLWREVRPRYVRAIVQGRAWRPTKEDLIALTCGKLTPEDTAEVVSWLTPESGVAAREMSIAGVPIDEGKVRCPVLVAATTLDILTPPARQRQVSSHYRADYVEFAQHAHFPMLEPGWERPAAVIGRWLEEAARIGDHNRGSVGRLSVRRSPTGTPLPIPAPTPSQPVAEPAPSDEAPPLIASPSGSVAASPPVSPAASSSQPTAAGETRSSVPPVGE